MLQSPDNEDNLFGTFPLPLRLPTGVSTGILIGLNVCICIDQFPSRVVSMKKIKTEFNLKQKQKQKPEDRTVFTKFRLGTSV